MTEDSMEIIVEAPRSLYTQDEWEELKRDRDALKERLFSEYKRGYDKGYRDAQYFFQTYTPNDRDEAEWREQCTS